MSTLHLLNSSPFDSRQLDSCLQIFGPDDGLLLTGNAVYALQAGTAPGQTLQALLDKGQVFALGEDLEARNLPALPGLQAIDYPGFVRLCSEFARVNSWL